MRSARLTATVLAVFIVAVFIVSTCMALAGFSATNGQMPAKILPKPSGESPPQKYQPTVDIIYPKDGTTLKFGTYAISILATDPSGIVRIVKVEIKIDGPESTQGWVDITASKMGDNYYYTWTVNTAGDYSITAGATNAVSRRAHDAVKVTVVASAPPPPAVVHDVAVIGITPSATEVTAGEAVTITVVVENQGTETETFEVTSYYGSVAIGTQTVTELAAGTTEMLTFSWDTTGLEGTYTIKAQAILADDEDPADNTLTDGTVTVSALGAPPTATHDLFIEIDYMVGHAPTPEVLDYIKWYYMGNNPSGELINVTFYVDDVVPYDPRVTNVEFWAIEAAYNDLGNDAYGTGDAVFGTSGVYSSKWKWVLYGTTVEGYPNVVGYTYVVITRVGWSHDLLAGNYIFIADETADNWALSAGIESYGPEAVVLMHEMGHSIGIGKLSWQGAEVYDSDKYSVMANLTIYNAGLNEAWYYSDEYWVTRNMEYYAIRRPSPFIIIMQKGGER